MSRAFSRTTRSLAADDFRLTTLSLLLTACVVAGWLIWFLGAKVTRYEVSSRARLEVDGAVHPVDAAVAGRIVATRLVLGEDVRAGDVLAEIDPEPQRLQLAEGQSRLAALSPQLEALREQVAAEERALGEAASAARVAREEARANFREGEAVAGLAEQEAKRAAHLHGRGMLADAEMLRAQAESQRRRAAAESLKLAVDRLAGEQQSQESDRRAHIERLERDLTRLEGERTTVAATIERLQHEIEKRHIRAPVTGRIGEVANLQIGTVVNEGYRLGAIVPPGNLKVVAYFHPPQVLGRILPGQPARVRLEGFPWAQYGSIAAKVSSVGSEAREGRVRVELTVEGNSTSRIPLQHGLPGDVEVEVERVTPATLALRAAGQLLTQPLTAVDSRNGRAAEQ
jgi:membrane fusion protein (multidrug efflux system)